MNSGRKKLLRKIEENIVNLYLDKKIDSQLRNDFLTFLHYPDNYSLAKLTDVSRVVNNPVYLENFAKLIERRSVVGEERKLDYLRKYLEKSTENSEYTKNTFYSLEKKGFLERSNEDGEYILSVPLYLANDPYTLTEEEFVVFCSFVDYLYEEKKEE